MTKTPLNIFEAVATGDIRKIIDVVDAAFKKAAREASRRAHFKGIEVADGHRDADRSEDSLLEDFERRAFEDDDTASAELLAQGFPVDIVRKDTLAGHVIRIHPDGREELVFVDREAAARILGR